MFVENRTITSMKWDTIFYFGVTEWSGFDIIRFAPLKAVRPYKNATMVHNLFFSQLLRMDNSIQGLLIHLGSGFGMISSYFLMEMLIFQTFHWWFGKFRYQRGSGQNSHWIRNNQWISNDKFSMRKLFSPIEINGNSSMRSIWYLPDLMRVSCTYLE